MPFPGCLFVECRRRDQAWARPGGRRADRAPGRRIARFASRHRAPGTTRPRH